MTDTRVPQPPARLTSAAEPMPLPTRSPDEAAPPGRRWPRRSLAVALLVISVGAWLIGQTYQLLLFAPSAVAIGSVAHRVVAAKQSRLHREFVKRPLESANRAALVQLGLRCILAMLVLLAADIAILDIQAGGLPSPATQWLLVVAPLLVFVSLQVLPTTTISRSLNAVVAVTVMFLGFQLIQVHANSSADDAVTLHAPFEGEWHVPSAGRSSLVTHHWTPLADQSYAVDFVVERNGRTHAGDSNDLASYYCWDEPMLAPADGTVVEAEDVHPDQRIGETASDNFAGNVVVIEFGPDLYVQLAHLRAGSVTVDVGDQVQAGDIIGRCGNSGHSLEPHLHMQVQDTPASNNHHTRGDGDSIPFRFDDITHIRNGDEMADQTSLFRRNDRVRTEP